MGKLHVYILVCGSKSNISPVDMTKIPNQQHFIPHKIINEEIILKKITSY